MKLTFRTNTATLALAGELIIAAAVTITSTWTIASMAKAGAPTGVLVLGFSIHTLICIVAATTAYSRLTGKGALTDDYMHREQVKEIFEQAQAREEHTQRLWRARMVATNVLLAHRELSGEANPCFANMELALQHAQALESIIEDNTAPDACGCNGCLADAMLTEVQSWNPTQLFAMLDLTGNHTDHEGDYHD